MEDTEHRDADLIASLSPSLHLAYNESVGIFKVVFSLAKEGIIGLNRPTCPYPDVLMAFPVATFAFEGKCPWFDVGH